MHFYHLSGEAYFLYKSEHTDKVHWLTVKAASATDTYTQIGDASHSDCVPATTFTSRPTLQSHHFFFLNSTCIVQIYSPSSIRGIIFHRHISTNGNDTETFSWVIKEKHSLHTILPI